MKSRIKFWIQAFCILTLPILGISQDTLNCDPTANLPITQGDVLINYGSATGVFTFKNKSSYTVAQPVVDALAVNTEYIAQFGYWSKFLIPPTAPDLEVSQGDFPDRTLIKWEIDPLSPVPTGGYVITRDGAFLGSVDQGVKQFIDFNVQAGEIYEYGVYGRNEYGNGSSATSLGFVNPNGTITGVVKTFSGNPVSGAIIRLDPSDGTALSFDGIDDHLCITYNDKYDTDMITISAYVKIGNGNDEAGIVDLGSDLNANYFIKTTNAADSKGVIIGTGDGSTQYTLSHEFVSDPDDWHQVTMVYAGGSLILYVDGEFINSTAAAYKHVPSIYNVGSNTAKTDFFKGMIDDVRIYNRPLTGSEIAITRNITVSKNTPGLISYWKFDEGIGNRTFDISENNIDADIFGPTFTDDNPEIINAGMTDNTGFYSIESINYSKNENFTATPSKIFYSNYALEFNSAYSSYGKLTSFDLPDSSTIEMSIFPFDDMTSQSILSNGSSNFDLAVNNGNLELTINGQTNSLGAVAKEYQHLAFVMNGSDGSVDFHRNGTLVSSISFGNITGDWSGSNWVIGSNGDHSDKYFTGLIDEVIFYKGISPIQEIQLHASTTQGGGTDVGNPNLLSYFDLNEGVGTDLFDAGPAMTGMGTLEGAAFSIITRTQSESPHVFTPGSRVVTINTSNTAASGVDFTDESVVPVTGVVRFEGTFCYQDSVEILVNGFPSVPPTFTDSVGRFTIDLEPGASVKLEPSYGIEEDMHIFSPPFYEVRKINRPIANVLFSNLVKRRAVGQLSGGDRRLPITNEGEIVRVKIAAQNQCYESEIQLDNLAGHFSFPQLPAVKMDVAVTYHDNNDIYTAMQVNGGQMSDLRNIKSDTLDFRYFVDPKVWIQPFEPSLCPEGDTLPFPNIEEAGPENGFLTYNKTIRMYEDYAGGRDWLDTFSLIITNNFNDESQDSVFVSDTTAYNYEYVAGQANIAGDFTKFLQVEGVNRRNINDVSVQRAVVIGQREREATFATASPNMPLLILRDPPGDGSQAVWEKGRTYCNTWSKVTVDKIGASQKDELKLGGDIEFSTGIGVQKTTKIELSNTLSVEASFETSKTSTSEANFCMTAKQTITTSDSEDVPTEDGDVFYGAAINFKFSGNDVLYVDRETCEYRSDSVTISVSPEGFATEYVYSAWQLKGTIIPNLELIGDTVSANQWRKVLEYNDRLKSNGVFDKNISFDGLTTYSESKEIEQSETNTFELEVEDNGEISNEFGVELDGNGRSFTMGITLGNSTTTSTETANTATSSVEYTLADDDPNDSYSVDIMNDPVMGTPYFQLVAGESMCPWIPGTLNREEIGFQIDRVTAVNVPENEAAIFLVKMSNLGQTKRDPLVYQIGLVQGSNPQGAIVQLDGESLINPISIQLQPEETKEFLISIEKGPDVNIFNYEDVRIYAASECQFAHARDLGYNIAGYADWEENNPGEPRPIESDDVREGIYNIVDLEKFYKQFSLNVEFLEPCSRVDVNFPLQNWVQTPDMGDNMTINLGGYNISDPDLELIRVQYRRTGGDGAWINIIEVPKADITSTVFHNVQWDMSQLSDGPYEIRALAICFSGLNPGISRVIQGRKETRPPQVFGTPQPADGVLSPGDEISIEFTKRINCDKVFQADGIGTNINLNNIALQDMTLGGLLVDATITCKDEKIFIVPNVPNQFIENHTLRATATDIEDQYGNKSELVSWEFFVNRSNLYWVGGDVAEVTVEGKEVTIEREIRNQSGEVVNFELYDIPDWAQVFPMTGTLQPGASIPITLQFSDDLVISDYNATIQLSEVVGSSTTPLDGNEPLNVEMRVTCPDPGWKVNASDYSFSMNFVLELDIEGELSADKLDQVGAFIDGELRGVANVEYERNLDKHLVFLTVYSNQGSGETIEFRIWDANICQMYAEIIETFPYAADGLIGTPLETQVIHTDGQVLRKIEIHPGWNWISFNVDFPDPTTTNVLSSLSSPSGALIKDQTNFSSYSDAASAWFGSLTELGYESLYQYKSDAHDSMFMVGFPVDANEPLALVPGWNWISYLPQVGMPVNDALQSLTPLNGDVIKSQLQFAVYVAGSGWIGNLDFLSPPNGYLINVTNTDTIRYPLEVEGASFAPIDFSLDTDRAHTLTNIDVLPAEQLPFDHWTVDPTQYEYSMNLIGVIVDGDNTSVLENGDEVGVFVNDDVRGSSKVTYIPELDAHMIFLTIYANDEGEMLHYKFYDKSQGEEITLNEKFGFDINNIVGEIDEPFKFVLDGTTSVGDLSLAGQLTVGPNPFSEKLMIDFVSPSAKKVNVKVTDALGSLIQRFDFDAVAGDNHLEWDPRAAISNGTYMIIFNDGETVTTKKILFIK